MLKGASLNLKHNDTVADAKEDLYVINLLNTPSAAQLSISDELQ